MGGGQALRRKARHTQEIGKQRFDLHAHPAAPAILPVGSGKVQHLNEEVALETQLNLLLFLLLYSSS